MVMKSWGTGHGWSYGLLSFCLFSLVCNGVLVLESWSVGGSICILSFSFFVYTLGSHL